MENPPFSILKNTFSTPPSFFFGGGGGHECVDFINLNDTEKSKYLLAPQDTDISKICVTEINILYELRTRLNSEVDSASN